MSEFHESKIESLIKEQGPAAASDQLRQRVQHLAKFHADTSRHRVAAFRRIRFAALAGIGGISVVAVIALAPTMIAANTLSSLTQAMDGTTSMHLRMLDVTGGKPKVMHEVWYQNGDYRMTDSSGYVSVWQRGISYTFDPLTSTVIRRAQPDGPFAHNGKGFKMSQILDDTTGGVRGKNVQITKSGGPTYKVQFDNAGIAERYFFVVDSKTDLPQSIEVDSPKAGIWIKRVEGTFEFNQPLSAHLFTPNFPGAKERIDLDAYKSGLATEFKGRLAFLPNGSETGGITIREAVVNRRGHLFLVYTGSGTSINRWLELKDDHGVRYARADLQAEGRFADHRLDVPGLPGLSVGWWVPEVPIGRFRPTRFTLSLIRNLRPNDSDMTHPEIKVIGETSFTVSKPSPTEVPVFLTAGDSFDLPRTPLDIRRGESFSLFLHFFHRFVRKDGTPIPDGGAWDGGPSAGLYHDPNDLRKAFSCAEQEVELARELQKQTGEDRTGQGYFDLFMASRLLGRIAESDGYLQQAMRSMDVQKNAATWLEYQTRLGNIPSKPIVP